MTTTLNFNVAGDPNDDQPTIIADNPPGGTLLASHFEGVPGQTPNRFVAEIPETITGGAWVTYANNWKRFRVIVPMGGGHWEAGQPPCLPPEYHGDAEKVAIIYSDVGTAVLPVLERVGRFFRKDGQRFFLNGATGFNATARFAYEGSDALRPLLDQRRRLGFNAIRLWTAYDVPLIGRLVPREMPDFYERIIPGVAHLCAEYGQYPYITGLTGAFSTTLGGMLEIADHDRRLQAALATVPFALYDRRNEASKPFNQIDMAQMSPLFYDMASQGSNQQDEDPPQPYGRFFGRHPGSSEWQRKVGKQNFDFANDQHVEIEGVDDETVRVEPAGEHSRLHCHDAGACGAFFIAGAFFHSAQAKLGIPWQGNRGEPDQGPEYDCAQGWCEGVQFVINQGLNVVQDGAYSNLGDRLPEVIRIYEKRLGTRVAHLEIHA